MPNDFDSSVCRYISLQPQDDCLLARIEERHLAGIGQHEVLWLAFRDIINANTTYNTMLISFSEVTHLTSLTVSMLLRIKQLAARQSLNLLLCEMNPGIRKIFKVLHLDGTMFEIIDSLEYTMAPGRTSPSYHDVFGVLD